LRNICRLPCQDCPEIEIFAFVVEWQLPLHGQLWTGTLRCALQWIVLTSWNDENVIGVLVAGKD